jgi:chain length determinant protein tyrosine kinase EpsG
MFGWGDKNSNSSRRNQGSVIDTSSVASVPPAVQADQVDSSVHADDAGARARQGAVNGHQRSGDDPGGSALAKLIPLKPKRVAVEADDQTQFAQTIMQSFGNRMIGELLQQQGHLSAAQIQQVLDYQRANNARFGEAAVTLGLVTGERVLWALSKQFGYDYSPVTTSRDAHHLAEDLVVACHPFSRAAETIRDLRSELLAGALNPEAANRCALAVVSLDSGDGKTWLAGNLAVSLSQLGAKTLLVDANLRAPRLHQVFGIENAKTGLSGILSRNLRAEVLRPSRALPNLHLLPAGAIPPNPLEMLQGRGFLDLIHKLRNSFTHVIIDTPPAQAGADARLVAARAGASLLVARRHKSSLPALKSFAQLLSKGNAQFAGLVLNDA